jgi:moderate conductance mechanosensitive channel
MAALATLLIAYVAWVLCQLAIDRHLQDVGAGPKLPGTDDDSESAPGSRLQTMLPLLRAAFGIVVAVIAALIVLSRLGIDTAPLIAGTGVFGLAISLGSQSLVRDIISCSICGTTASASANTSIAAGSRAPSKSSASAL